MLAALTALTVQGEERFPTVNASGDCGNAVRAERTHKRNPLKLLRQLDDTVGESAIMLSSIGIREQAPACTAARVSTPRPKRSETPELARAEAQRTETIVGDE